MRGCRPLTDSEIALVGKSFGSTYAARDRALFVLGIKSGFRISELLSLKVGDVYQHGCMVDRVTVARRYMKRKTEGRTVLLHPEAKAALQAWLDKLNHHGLRLPTVYLFHSRKGTNRPMTRVQAWRIWKDAYATNSLTGKLGTHSLRKTFADHIYERLQHDLVSTQKALEHRHTTCTMAYLARKEEAIDQAILAL